MVTVKSRGFALLIMGLKSEVDSTALDHERIDLSHSAPRLVDELKSSRSWPRGSSTSLGPNGVRRRPNIGIRNGSLRMMSHSTLVTAESLSSTLSNHF